jgi:UDP-N-acetylglucosamine 1-carboxyvinyltransferase
MDNGGDLKGAEVKALDLRAGAALLLSGLTADGETKIVNGWQINRGYNHIVDKLANLGANVVKVKE